MSRRADVSALILAGGQATRMGGRDKRTLVVDGRTIFERQVEVLAPRVAEIIVSARGDGRAALDGYRTVLDAVHGAGPLAGLAAGLAASATPWLLVVAGDMPWIAGAVIDRLLARASDPVDAVGVRVGELPEPLLCVVRVATVRPEVERRLAARRYKASELLTRSGLDVTWLDASALRDVDPELRSLRNVNTPADLATR